MPRPFDPRPKQRRDCWEVDCRPWIEIMTALQQPKRRRFQSRAEALTWCQGLVASELTGAQIQHRASVSAYFDRYLRSCETNLAPGSRRAYRKALRRFRAWCRSNGIGYLHEIDPLALDTYRADLVAAGLSRNTVALYMTVLSAAFSWGARLRLIDANPLKGMVPRKEKPPRRALTDEERALIVNSDGPLRDLWLAYLLTGLRLSELATLPCDAVKVESPAPHLEVVGKGGKRRTVPLDPVGVACFRRLLEAAHGSLTVSPYLPGTISGKWRQERGRLGLPADITVHTFRHDFASDLANDGITPLTEVRDILGHSTVKMTEVYVHPDRSKQRAGVARRGARIGAVRREEVPADSRRRNGRARDATR